MKTLLLWLSVSLMSPSLQSELLNSDGEFNYDRFWNPDIRMVRGDRHTWCWGQTGINFTDDDIVALVNGGEIQFTEATSWECRKATR